MAENETLDTKGIPPEIERYLSMWERDPKSRVFAPLAEAYRKVGDLDRAIEICLKGLQIHPNYVSGRVALGRAYFDRGDYLAAKTQLEMVFEADPENLVAAKTLGEIYRKEGELEKALLAYRLAHYTTPSATEIVEKVRSLEAALAVKGETPGDVTRHRDVEKLSSSLEAARAALRKSEARAAGELPEDDVESEKDIQDEVERLRSAPERLVDDEDELALEMDLFFSEISGPSVGGYSDFQVRGAAEAMPAGSRERSGDLVKLTLTELMLRQGYVERAVKVYEEFLESEPDSSQAIKRVGELNEQLLDIKYEVRIREGEPGRQVQEEEASKEVANTLVDWLQNVKPVY